MSSSLNSKNKQIKRPRASTLNADEVVDQNQLMEYISTISDGEQKEIDNRILDKNDLRSCFSIILKT